MMPSALGIGRHDSPYPIPWELETWFTYDSFKEVDGRLVNKDATNVETRDT